MTERADEQQDYETNGEIDSYADQPYDEQEFDPEGEYDETYEDSEEVYEEMPEAYVPVAETTFQPVAENPRVDDTDADADVVRPQRAAQYRAQRRSQFSMAIPAFLMISVGALLLINVFAPGTLPLTVPILIGIGVGVLALSLLARFMINGRSERGLLFVGLTIVILTIFAGLNLYGVFDITLSWPLILSVIGAAMLGMYLFEKNRDQGLLLPALVFLGAGFAALPFTMGMIPAEIISGIAVYWPLVFLLLGLILLPQVVRSR